MTDRPPMFERVYTFTDYYDGPREGIADFHGIPHQYHSLYLDRGNSDDDRFELTPVTQEVLALAMEDWAICCRWELAFHAGESDIGSHPALPQDRARHEAIKQALAHAPTTGKARAVLARGEFRVAEPVPDLPRGVLRPLEVRWHVIDADAGSV